MPEYRLNLTEDDPEEISRQRTLQEIHQFIANMDGRPLAIATLNAEQSRLWDDQGDIDYQDAFGRQIIKEISGDGSSETLVIRSCQGLPLALAARGDRGWQGLGIDRRLRSEIAPLLQNDENDFE